MKKRKRKPINKTMRRLMTATSPAERQAALRQLRKTTLEEAPEQRGGLYRAAMQELRDYAVEQAMKVNLDPQTEAMYQELKLLKSQVNSIPLLPVGADAVHRMLDRLTHLCERLEEAEDEEKVHRLIQGTLTHLSANPSSVARAAGYHLVVSMLEKEILYKYQKTVEGSMESGCQYIPSLLSTLEKTQPHTLALAFLGYNAKSNTFFTVAPSALADMNDPERLRQALALYRTVLQNAKGEEARACGEMLRRGILIQFINWMDEDGPTHHRDIDICLSQLEKVMQPLDSDTWRDGGGQEPFHQVTAAINSACYLALETVDDDALDANCVDQAEALTLCPSVNGPLTALTEFALVCRLLQALKLLKVELPTSLEILVRAYLIMFLSDDCTLSDEGAFAWVVGGASIPFAA